MARNEELDHVSGRANWAGALRPAIVIGAICEMIAMAWMGTSGPIQGDWRRGLQLFVVFLVPAVVTWLLVVLRSARDGSS